MELKAGESKEVTIPLDDKAFRYWNVRTNRWETEDGAYVIGIGASSEDIRLSAQVEVSGTGRRRLMRADRWKVMRAEMF